MLENFANDLLDAERVWVATNITILYLFQYEFGLPYCIFSRQTFLYTLHLKSSSILASDKMQYALYLL